MKILIFFLTCALTITLFTHNGYTEPVVTDGLVSYWTFDKQDIAGGTVKDVWGENDARSSGIRKSLTGKSGKHLNLTALTIM